jgi:hypothetical protein
VPPLRFAQPHDAFLLDDKFAIEIAKSIKTDGLEKTMRDGTIFHDASQPLEPVLGDEYRLLSKIHLHVLPILFYVYLVTFLDRYVRQKCGIIKFALIETMPLKGQPLKRSYDRHAQAAGNAGQ